MNRARPLVALAAALLAAVPAPHRGAAQTTDPLRLPASVLDQVVYPGPAGSITTPTAFGTDLGQAFVGVGLQGRTRYTDEADAALVAGVGLGNRRVIGLEAAVTSYSTFSDRGGTVGEVGALSLRVHRLIQEDFAVAVGWENLVHWGDTDAGESRYVVASRIFRNGLDPEEPFSATVISMGLGDGRFRFEEDVDDEVDRINFFMSVGMRVDPNASAIVDWTGQDLNLALSVMPLGRRLPIVVTPGAADVLGYAGDGVRPILAVGYNFNFGNPFAGRN
jgi:hypothetical protein